MTTRVLIVTHEVLFEPPNTVVIVGHGVMDGESSSKIHGQMLDWVKDQPYMFLLADFRDVTGFSTDGRKSYVASANTGELPPRAVALWGASFGVRVIFDMVARARSFLRLEGRWMKYCSNIEEARQWAAEIRPALEAFAQKHKPNA